ncbi:MAG: uridylate kinase [Methanomicrobiales archaeon]|nr:uridylate kinase [Methanomicrobiales archaeon]NYT21353.1 uridylate kinase [Methanomicrobiales archaeon]
MKSQGMSDQVVVKIGGSLADQVLPLIETLRTCRRPALIVPGGGRFARLVRESPVEGDAAHWMAVCAMEQFGWLISQQGIPPADDLHVPETLEVLLPYLPLRNADPLPHSWDVTSDTIAAWVAASLSLDLIVLKSVDGIRSEGMLIERLSRPVETDDVDVSFLPFVLSHGVRVVILNGRIPGRLESWLRGHPVTGTTIGF